MAETTKTEAEAPEQDDSPSVVIEPAQNGGFIVRQLPSPGVQAPVLGAFSSGTDLMRGLPDILGLDGLRVETHSKFGLVDNSTTVFAQVRPDEALIARGLSGTRIAASEAPR